MSPDGILGAGYEAGYQAASAGSTRFVTARKAASAVQHWRAGTKAAVSLKVIGVALSQMVEGWLMSIKCRGVNGKGGEFYTCAGRIQYEILYQSTNGHEALYLVVYYHLQTFADPA